MNVSKVRIMIHKYRCSNIPFCTGTPAVSGDETRSWANELIHADDFAGTAGLSKMFALSFVTVGLAVCFSIGASRAHGRGDVCKLFRNEARAGEQSKFGKGEVT